MAHDTMIKFGYPDTLIRELDFWTVQLRPKQATLGAMVLICKEDVTAFSDISAGAFAELPQAVTMIERAAGAAFSYDKINYLMLMMVDPHVHFHVLPRYTAGKEYAGAAFSDPGWPGPPELGHDNDADDAVKKEIMEALKSAMA